MIFKLCNNVTCLQFIQISFEWCNVKVWHQSGSGNFPSSHLRPKLYNSWSCFVAFVVIFISFTFSREWEVSCFVIRWCVVGPTSQCSAVRTIDHVCFAVTDYLYCIANYSAPHTNTNCQAWVQTLSRSSQTQLHLWA